MWDSLETIWRAAFEDKEYCNTYVVPIPYADLTPEGKAAKWHCEIDLFPKDVPVLDYRKVNLKKLKPDAIFIHNPYDNYNLVTSVDSNYYSANLKPLTKLLVYVPYYATSGVMSEGQRYMPSYTNSDYIIIQSDAMRPFFDSSIPDEKLLSLGSPKFDRVIQMCKNPPEIPDNWKNKMEGRRVYFYNTSLSGMLRDTERFLQKMKYVFETFEKNPQACLLWRPHPLTNATLNSMRREAQEAYNQLKNYFIEHDLGIYDDTPDVDKSIALSDVYVGDTATSITSLFGVAGKPMFFLNNYINSLPQKDDWKSFALVNFNMGSKDWIILYGDKLYNAQNGDYKYHYYCDLSEYALGGYYADALEIEGRVYICPINTNDILILKDHKIENRIQLKDIPNGIKLASFYGAVQVKKYLFLLPNKYPYLVRYDTENNELRYIDVPENFFSQLSDFSARWGQSWAIWNDQLMIISPNNREILSINIETLGRQQISIPSRLPAKGGFLSIVPDGNTFWLLPLFGKSIIRLNMAEGTVDEYNNFPSNFQCHMMPQGFSCDDRPFSSAVCSENEVFLAPFWGNMFVRLDKKTGQMREWKTPFSVPLKCKSSYFIFSRISTFRYLSDKKEIFFFYDPERQWYILNLETNAFKELELQFDLEELNQHQSFGFDKLSEYLPYGCPENVYHTLKDLLEDKLPGQSFSKEAQLKSYEKLNACMEGDSGEKIYRFVKQKLEKKGVIFNYG